MLMIAGFVVGLGVLYYTSGGAGGRPVRGKPPVVAGQSSLRFAGTEEPKTVHRGEDPAPPLQTHGSVASRIPIAAFGEPEHPREKVKTYSLSDGGATATAPEDWAAPTDAEGATCALPALDDTRSQDMLPARPVLASCRYGMEADATGFARLRANGVEFDAARCPYGRAVGKDDFGAVAFTPLGDATTLAPVDADFAYARCRASGATDLLTRFRPSAAAADRARAAAPSSQAPAGGSGADRAPSVLLLHLAGLSRRQAVRALPRTMGLLRAARRDTGGDWVGFHARRAHAPTANPRHNLAALLAGRVSFGRFDTERPLDWVWERAKAAGYVTAVGNNGCDREAATFGGAGGRADHDLLSHMACSVLQHHFGVSSLDAAPSEQLCVAGRHFHEFFLDHALAALTAPAYAGLPVLVALSLHDAADRDLQRAFSLDAALYAAVRRVMEEAPHTALAIVSEGGNTVSEYYFGTQAGRAEAVLPAAFLLLPSAVLAAHDGAEQALAANQDVLISPASVYSTLVGLMGPAAAPADADADADDAAARRGLLAPLPATRGCSDAAVQPSVCQCAEWGDTDRDSRGLAEFVLSEVNARVWRPNYYKQDPRRACQAMRLAEVEEVTRLTFPAQEASPTALPLLPSPQRFRLRLRTRGGRGFKGQVFEAEVIDFTWRFQRSRDRGVHLHSVYDVVSITRVTPTDAYKRCLGEYEGESTPLDFCVCDVSAVRDDDAEFDPKSKSVDDVLDAALRPRRRDRPEVDDGAAPQAAVRVPMVQKDEVEMLRWSHNGVETFEVNNMKNADIMFKISMQRGVNGVNNVRSSHSMPVWRYVPAFTTRALTVLEREAKDEPWTWNFDWRWDVVDRSHYEPPRFVSPVRFKSLDVFYKMREGVAIVKLFDMFPKKGKRRSVAYEVFNLRTEPIEYELEVFMSGARRVRAPSGSHKRIRLDPGEQKQLVHIEATTGHPEKAREALHALKHVGSWESLGA